MTTVSIELPDEVFSAVRRAPEEFVRELRRKGMYLSDHVLSAALANVGE